MDEIFITKLSQIHMKLNTEVNHTTLQQHTLHSTVQYMPPFLNITPLTDSTVHYNTVTKHQFFKNRYSSLGDC